MCCCEVTEQLTASPLIQQSLMYLNVKPPTESSARGVRRRISNVRTSQELKAEVWWRLVTHVANQVTPCPERVPDRNRNVSFHLDPL